MMCDFDVMVCGGKVMAFEGDKKVCEGDDEMVCEGKGMV